jgi:O-acetylhomoserine/O-acetylserine sulfhydrylase-like pyridoxal-dependent enzyme
VQAATFSFSDMDRFAEVGERKIAGGYLYSRWAKPTVRSLARTLAALEGAEAAACFGSGMAAIYAALTSVAGAGDHIVAAAQVYGGTRSLLNGAMTSAGVASTTVDITDLRAVEAAFTDRTRVLYAETIGNPGQCLAVGETFNCKGILLAPALALDLARVNLQGVHLEYLRLTAAGRNSWSSISARSNCRGGSSASMRHAK